MSHFHEAQTPEDIPAEMQGEPIAQDKPIAPRVWVVYDEWQNGESSVVGVFATEAGANVARDSEIRYLETTLHKVVWQHTPEDADEDYDADEWDVDVHIEAFEVQS